MKKVGQKELKETVEGLHSCKAIFSHIEHVHETFQGQTVWEDDVHVFNLKGHKEASVCYAWSEPVQNSDRHRFYAVLHIVPVKSAQDAVRASLLKDYRESKNPS